MTITFMNEKDFFKNQATFSQHPKLVFKKGNTAM